MTKWNIIIFGMFEENPDIMLRSFYFYVFDCEHKISYLICIYPPIVCGFDLIKSTKNVDVVKLIKLILIAFNIW